MTLPTGTISLSQVNVELLKSATITISLNDTDVRSLAATGAAGTPTYVGGTSQGNDDDDLTLSGLQSGDLVLFFSASDYTDRATPTLEVEGQTGSWTAIPGIGFQPNNNNSPDSSAFYIFSQGSEVTAGNLNVGVHVMIAFRGVDSNNAFNATSASSGGEGMPDPPNITSLSNGCMIVAAGVLDDDAIASSVTAPSGYTLAVVKDQNNASCTVMAAYKAQTSAGGENPGAFGGNGSDQHKAATIALKGGSGLTISGSQISMDDLRGLTGETLYSTDLEIWLDAGSSGSYSGSGTTWTDLQNDYDGELKNGVGYSSSNNGYLTFDGSNDYVLLDGTDGINAPMSKDMTISVWLYRTKSYAWQGVFTKDVGSNRRWGLWISNGNRFMFGAVGSICTQVVIPLLRGTT